jgi:hypothetical protein
VGGALSTEEAGFDSVAKSDAVFFPEHISAKYHGSPDGNRYWPPDTPSGADCHALRTAQSNSA